MAFLAAPGLAAPPLASVVGVVVALGMGLLIGAERERRKRERAPRAAAGIRTFALVALSGAVAMDAAGATGLAVVTVGVGALAAISAWAERKSKDPGFTTEAALVLTVLLGGLATRQPTLAAMVGVAATILLAARSPLHRFVASVLTAREMTDALVLAGASLVVLPLLPDRAFGPFAVLNPRQIWILVILVLCVGAAGHVAVRLAGVRFGLPLAGLLGGFVSSAATIGAMGARARAAPGEASASAAGAVLSTVATMAQLALVVGAVSRPTLQIVAPSLLVGGGVAVAFATASMLRAIATPAAPGVRAEGAFSLTSALLFAGVVCAVLLLAAASRAAFGHAGVSLAAAVAGLADTHAAAISVATLVADGQITPKEALAPILLGIASNTAVKLALALANGGRGFLVRVGPGLLLVAAATWLPVLLGLRL
jgi:uncharacterized membrane protein (DUF4010 family)